MYKVREDEPDYAFIADVQAAETNCYGSAIQLVEESDPLAGQSLNINGDTGIGNNPNRYKQHGFYFTADILVFTDGYATKTLISDKSPRLTL